jgi:Flp pilus assembly protein TadD
VSSISFCILSLFEEAADAARHVLELQPDSTAGLWPLGVALTGLGRIDPALATLERLCQLSRAPLYVGQLGLAYGVARRHDDARRLLNELDERATRGEYVAPCARLAIAIGLDDITGIRTALTACVDDTTPANTVKVVCGPFLERYRSDSEIDSLCNRIYRAL